MIVPVANKINREPIIVNNAHLEEQYLIYQEPNINRIQYLHNIKLCFKVVVFEALLFTVITTILFLIIEYDKMSNN